MGPEGALRDPAELPVPVLQRLGREPVRLSCTNDAPLTINLYHNLDFVFENDFDFADRVGDPKYFDGEGRLALRQVTSAKVQNIWETNFVHDLTSFKLYEFEGRGKGSMNVNFVLADGTMHSHVSQMPVGRYKKAHRHAAGTHVHAVDGSGYSLLWYEGDDEFVELPWRHGIMYTPPFWMFHQHFNTADQPARYVACSLGSRRYPFISLRRKSAEGRVRSRSPRAAVRSSTTSRTRACTASSWRRAPKTASSPDGRHLRRAGDHVARHEEIYRRDQAPASIGPAISLDIAPGINRRPRMVMRGLRCFAKCARDTAVSPRLDAGMSVDFLRRHCCLHHGPA